MSRRRLVLVVHEVSWSTINNKAYKQYGNHFSNYFEKKKSVDTTIPAPAQLKLLSVYKTPWMTSVDWVGMTKLESSFWAQGGKRWSRMFFEWRQCTHVSLSGSCLERTIPEVWGHGQLEQLLGQSDWYRKGEPCGGKTRMKVTMS